MALKKIKKGIETEENPLSLVVRSISISLEH